MMFLNAGSSGSALGSGLLAVGIFVGIVIFLSWLAAKRREKARMSSYRERKPTGKT